MQKKATEAEYQHKQGQKDWNTIQYVPGDWNSPYDQHDCNNQKGNKHFESINAHSDYDKNKFLYIYLGNNGFIIFDYLYTLH